jgi:hypothetical protein
MIELNTLQDVKLYNNYIRRFVTQDDITRKYLVFKSFSDFNNNGKSYIHLHEVIFSDKPRKFFVDLDAKRIDKSTCDEHKNIILNIIRQLFAKIYFKIIDTINYVVIDSCGQVEDYFKYSVNVLIDGYSFADYAEFRWFGEQVCEAYYSRSDSIQGFLDENFFKRRYVDSYISARLPNCTKGGEKRYKTITSEHSYEDGIISYVQKCEKLPNKSNVNRDEYAEKYKKQKAVELSHPDIQFIITNTQHLWIKNFQIRSTKSNENSTSIHFDRIKPSHCYFCNEVHHNDNSLILSKYGNRIYESCRQNKGSRVVYEDGQVEVVPLIQPKERKPNIDKPVLDYDLMFPPSKNIYFIKAEMKMGKTKQCIQYINKTNPTTVILISFRRTFSSEMKSKYVGFELYSDIKDGQINLSEHPKLIVQVESIHRIAKKMPIIDLIILDEIESIWGQFSSGNLLDYYGVVNTFTYLVRKSTKIIAMDANLSKRSSRLLQYLRPEFDNELNLYINRHNPSYDYKYYFVGKVLFYSLISKHLHDGNKIVIITNSLKETNQLAQYVSEQFSKLKLIVYNSKTLQSKKTKHFSDVNRYWKKYDCVIYSPTVSAGVSFEAEHFNYVFGSFTSMSCNVETCRQMLGRVRNIVNKTIYLNIKSINRESDEYPTNPDTVRTHLRYHREKLVKNASEVGLLNFEYMQSGQSDYYDNFAYRLVSENIAFDNKSRNNFLKRFLYYFNNTGTNYEFINQDCYNMFGLTKKDIDMTSLKITSNKMKVEKREISSILNATDIDGYTYGELKNKITKCQDVSHDELKSMDKFRISNTLNVELDQPLVSIFMDNNNLRRFNMTRSLLSNSSTANDINKMKNYILSGADLGDAVSKYNSVIHHLVKKLFSKVVHPSIRLSHMFTCGSRLLRETDEEVDIKKLRGLLAKLINCSSQPMPTKLHEYDITDVFKMLMKIMNNLYWIEINGLSCKTKNGVTFKYKDKLFTGAIEVESTTRPVILIECD